MRGEYSWKVGGRGPRGENSAQEEGLVSVIGLHNGAAEANQLVLEASLEKDKSTHLRSDTNSQSLVDNRSFASARYLIRKKIAR